MCIQVNIIHKVDDNPCITKSMYATYMYPFLRLEGSKNSTKARGRMLLDVEEEPFTTAQDCCNKSGITNECIGSCESEMCKYILSKEGASNLKESSCATYKASINQCCWKGIN